MAETYIHYGHRSFDVKKFIEPKNMRYRNKPNGGFWASAVDAEFGWRDWNEQEDFVRCDDGNALVFRLADGAKIYVINTVEDALSMPQAKQPNEEWSVIMRDSESYPNFEAMRASGVDAILYNFSADHRLYWSLYGWDCDSLLILNPDVVVPVEYKRNVAG